jgi:glycogen phosphorylase
MSNPTYSEFSSETRASEALTQLALDLYWTWNHSADEVWKRLDPVLWDLTANPWLILQAVSQRKLDEITDSAFRTRVEELRDEIKQKKDALAWFESAHSGSLLRTAAYFSMEYMLGEALPIYSGGLGNVAGDQLKAASDLGVPVVAVGLLYQQGYFRQELDANGNQLALYPVNEPGQLPIRPLRTNGGEWLRIPFTLPGVKIWIRTWEVQVGRARLYLLDTNDPANLPQHRGITSELYGGGPELRLKQELVLGVVGWRLLRALDIRPEVCHLNEGHAAFAVLERARSYMEDTGVTFAEALTITRAGNVFTTHTAVDAGFDRFAPELIRQFLSRYAEDELRIPLTDLLAMGRANRGNDSEPFNMAYLAMRASGSANGVSRLHGHVSRRLFGPLFPRFPEVEVPVGYVTNGIHVPTWDSAGADTVWTEQCGKGLWRGDLGSTTEKFRAIDERRLWSMRAAGRRALVEYARERLARQEASYSGSPEEVQEAGAVLESETLTLGFARRFATYKRPTLLLHDRERLVRILTNPQRPVQLVIAGKAHPQDEPGRALIREWTNFARQPRLRRHVVFLADYDMLLAERLVEGVDVWINTPRRPWEASGTSGMKVLVNGGLNLSVLDGWWAEAYAANAGWAIGDGAEHGDDPAWDHADAEALYAVLEQQIIPEFYARDESGLPKAWVRRISESMAILTPAFSANRAVRQYTEEHYIPAANAYAVRSADSGRAGVNLLAWRQRIGERWGDVRFGALKTQSRGSELLFEQEVYLAGLDPSDVRVELYADSPGGGAPFRQEMERTGQGPANSPGFVYTALISTDRPAGDFTPRVIPHHNAATRLEIDRIVWQR